jgi:phosphoribosylformylglycinamidine cyclo-ligase
MPGNLPRVLPETVSVELDWGAWSVPPIFAFLQHTGQIPVDEMQRVFNLGLGLVFVGAPTFDPRAQCPSAVEVGRIVARRSGRVMFRGE